ncbi:uncharacterized protein MONBRDRAFT_18151 [Monosiga brevicollis MX1]|uniref:HECT-type E3 ubiquitin transferase n=1 Tax=Monosiga brevicollis TaxID=81824 RepID=A9UU88_MONBE|nr:uncharacterized protein MONBRDRAFT_18151 [Monosiga brevicollis MX1]EDQ91626.1 predicted protein [Monosiga brevicollis MX1]|eukprot:XP_001744048.1 hypothetical protein [Monosiga brevicollis MX1]
MARPSNPPAPVAAAPGGCAETQRKAASNPAVEALDQILPTPPEYPGQTNDPAHCTAQSPDSVWCPPRRAAAHQPLPAGWSSVIQAGRHLFVWHADRRTTFVDPRLDDHLPPSLRRLALPTGWELEFDDDDEPYFISHTARRTERRPSWLSRPRCLNPQKGIFFFFQRRSQWALAHFPWLERTTLLQMSSLLVLQREGLMRDSWLAMTALPVHQLQRRLFVSFEGEAGRDFGGLAREWMDLMCNGMSHHLPLALVPTMTPTKEALDTIEFLGRVVGLALFHGRLINPHFSLIVYKMLLDQPCASLDDLATVDPEMHHGYVLAICSNDVCRTDLFSPRTVGSTKPVTDANKRDYVDCLLQWRLNRGVAELLEAFKIGLTSFIPLSALAGFTAPRLRLLVSGLQQIDVREWRTATAYVNGYGEDAIQVQWFWQWVDQADEAQRAKLLTFCTGSTQLPAQGFHGLSGIHGYCPFVIARVGDVDRYPAAHTCVNRLDLPAYASRDVLHARLSFAVQETEGFGLV